MGELTLEQKIVKHLASQGYLTNVGDVTTALEDNEYAKKLITGNDIPGIDDEIEDSGMGGSDCDHEALTNDEIQVVFDNDEDEDTNN